VIHLQTAKHGLTDAIIPTNPTHCYHPPMIDWHTCTAVERDPDRVGGAWVFRGTRVPVAALFENLEDDVSLHQFVECFPGVTLEQAHTVLGHAAHSSSAVASAADLQVNHQAVEIRPLNRNPRQGWAADSQRIAQFGDDALVWPEFANATLDPRPR
jgi:uncharacterized protein (DUF433 family)